MFSPLMSQKLFFWESLVGGLSSNTVEWLMVLYSPIYGGSDNQKNTGKQKKYETNQPVFHWTIENTTTPFHHTGE